MIKLKKIKRDKKGFLLGEETLKIIISVIVIIILVALLVSLYYSRVRAEKQRQAISKIEGSNQLSDLIKITTENTPQKLHLTSPTGWYFFTFTGTEMKPNACRGMNCACICSRVSAITYRIFTARRERQVEECEENGACLFMDNPGLKNYGSDNEVEFTITGDNWLLIEKKNNLIEFSETIVKEENK